MAVSGFDYKSCHLMRFRLFLGKLSLVRVMSKTVFAQICQHFGFVSQN